MGTKITANIQKNNLKYKIGFVILHYKVASITEECIENIMKQDYENFNIVVVDNFSNNGSLETLQEKYGSNSIVYFVPLEKNYGFAKANDVGYQISKHKFQSQIIAVINNDLMIENADFCNQVNRICQETHFDILGPDIINNGGEHQNPLAGCVTTKEEVDKLIWKSRVKLLVVSIAYGLKKLKKTKNTKRAEVQLFTQRNVPLHGSCLIFGAGFIKQHEFPFLPDTFLYGEEDILFHMVNKEKLLTVFEPSVVVRHMEDASTDAIMNTSKEKRLFELKNSIRSLEILKNELRK